jgi:nucleoside-diphosphate-sugar epimerase
MGDRRLVMRVAVIGGTGHIGTYLVPRLVDGGYEVTVLSRGRRDAYQPHGAWRAVRRVAIDRIAEEQAGCFGQRVAALDPDIVIDLTCFTLDSASQLVDSLRGQVQHLLHCGTIWVHGPGVEVPTTEDTPRRPFGDYGCRKAGIERYLLAEARARGLPATVLHPGHIVGEGWPPLNPAGHFNPAVFSDLAAGRELVLPHLGLETVHHVHADDVAQGFMKAMASRSAAVGESFHIVSPAAVTLRGYAERMAAWFGCEARLRFVPWDEWRRGVPAEDAEQTLEHISHSPNCSIEKARRQLGYSPRYTSLQAVQESVRWLMRAGLVHDSRGPHAS